MASSNVATKRYPILSLPLVAPSSRLTNCLLPDPITPTPSSLLSNSTSSASLLRRSRGVGEGSHFSYVTPLVLEFPYDLESAAEDGEKEPAQTEAEFAALKEKVDKMTEEEKQKYGLEKARERMEAVERMMRPYELDPESVPAQGDYSNDRLTAYIPPARKRPSYPSARILAVSQACMSDCLPHLDVGDTLEWIAARSGKDGPDCFSSGPMASTPEGSAANARCQLSDYLSGRLVGASLPDLKDVEVEEGAEVGVAEAKHQQMVRLQGKESTETDVERWHRRSGLLQKRQSNQKEYTGYTPWTNNYSGHQFGVWAGQLGDGRAVTLMETTNPSTNERWEIQLKGAGRTPYSRFADGLATLKSSLREFLASEALARLGVPTSRALSLISVKDVAVVRERREAAGITARLAPIWTRIGSFEHHATRKEWESVRLLGEFVCREGYRWDLGAGTGLWAKKMVEECAVRNAKMIAAWQTIGFMHGVINTDNVSLLGVTIDFGPYAFMDVKQDDQICNHSDGEGRYTFRNQPTMGLYAINKLFDSVAPLVGFEREKGRCPAPGELVFLSADEIAALSKKGAEAEEEVKNLFMDTLLEEWKRLWLKKLAVQSRKEDDRDTLIDPLLYLLEDCDFTSSIRRLSGIVDYLDRPEEFAKEWLDWTVVPSYARSSKEEQAKTWLTGYASRLKEESRGPDELRAHLNAVNPAFVLRNWVTNEVAQRLAEHDDTDFLDVVLQLCLHPFEEPKSEEVKRLFKLGLPLNGALPSCSS